MRLVSIFCFGLLFSLTPIKAQPHPPDCAYMSVQTPHQDLDDWSFTLLDTLFQLSPSYAPTDLQILSDLGINSDKQIRAIMANDLKQLMQEATAAGYLLVIQSAYRSYNYQAQTFAYWVEQEGEEAALKSSARAGHSEHQLGTAIDFRSEGGPPAWELEDWATSPEGAWLAENGWRYGFVMSYPKGKETTTCYIYEPWHYRYIGKENAADFNASGLSLREWIWNRQ